MANDITLTNRFKIPIPDENHTDWLVYLQHWAEIMEVMFTALSNKDYVIGGLTVGTTSTSLNFSYSGGAVSINSVQINISSGSGLLVANTFNWIYVQNGQMRTATLPPSGSSYVPIACAQTDSDGVVGLADIRPSPPTINNISINPSQVNPTSHINMAAAKRVVHADSNVGSNIVMFIDSEIQTVKSWVNQAVAKDWESVDVSTFVPSGAKFAILNCYMATFNEPSNGWATLEVKTETLSNDYVYNFTHHGNPDSSAFNPSQIGSTNQIMLALDTDKKFLARTLIDSAGGSGTYFAFVKLVGYII